MILEIINFKVPLPNVRHFSLFSNIINSNFCYVQSMYDNNTPVCIGHFMNSKRNLYFLNEQHANIFECSNLFLLINNWNIFHFFCKFFIILKLFFLPRWLFRCCEWVAIFDEELRRNSWMLLELYYFKFIFRPLQKDFDAFMTKWELPILVEKKKMDCISHQTGWIL